MSFYGTHNQDNTNNVTTPSTPLNMLRPMQDTPAINEPETPLTLSEILKRGWFLFTFQAWKQLFTAFIGGLPMSLLFAFVLSLDTLLGKDVGNLWIVCLVFFDVFYILYLPSIFGAIACLTSAAHCGEEITLTTAYKRTWAHYLQLSLAFFGVYFGTLLGLYLLIIPGIYFLSKYGLAWIIVPIEKCTAGASFKRSAELLRGRRRVFLLIQLVFVLLYCLMIGGVICLVIFTEPLISDSFVKKFFVMFTCLQASIFVIVPYIPMVTAFYFDAVKRARDPTLNV